jgi:hypothetical protein
LTHYGSAFEIRRTFGAGDAFTCLRSITEIIVPHSRPRSKGSFASHFDELVAHFPARLPAPDDRQSGRSPELQEKLDIHALLFERAWRIDEDRD